MNILRFKYLNVARLRILQFNTRFQSTNTAPAVNIPVEPIVQPSEPLQSPSSVTKIKKCDKRLSMYVKLDREPMILPFDDVPGPKALKYFSNLRNHLTKAGTHVTAAALYGSFRLGLIGGLPTYNIISKLFDSYGPVVRFITPIGADIVLLNHPDHIQRVFNLEGDCPVRSALDSVEKYRTEYKNQTISGIYSVNGPEWQLQRKIVDETLNANVTSQLYGMSIICDTFAHKVYNMRNNQDEIPKDIYKEIHKWAFDCIGQIIFSKKFSMLETDVVYSHCDMSWLYFSLDAATDAINKCENGLHLWKFFSTPSWKALVKYCDSMDGIISKYVVECEEQLQKGNSEDVIDNVLDKKSVEPSYFISSILNEHKNVKADDVCTIIMDMLIIGVNTITSSMSFMLYYLAKYQKVQKTLYNEILEAYPQEEMTIEDIMKIKENTPYLQNCIAETLRLAPPIPVLTRILSKNIHIDRFNIPRGTLIMMCAQNASTKESNFDDCKKFNPDRWSSPDKESNHPFASVPFGYGSRKCIGQNIAVTIMSLLTTKILRKYRIEHHYGDIYPTRSFISKPNKELRLRFLDRY